MYNNSNLINIIIADYDKARLMDMFTKIQNANPMLRVVSICENGEDLIDRASTMKVDAVLMDFNLIDKTAINIATELKEFSPETDVFTISDSISAEFIFNAKNKGIAEVFKRDTLVASEVAVRIVNHVQEKRKEWERLANEHGAIQKGTKNTKVVTEYITKTISQSVILTYNMKGGVGKSTVASNLAVAIKTSPFFSGRRIALVDFDCGGANVSTLCNIPDVDTVGKNLAAWDDNDYENFTPEEVDSLMIRGPHGIMVLPAPLNLVQAERVSYELSDNILKTLKKFFDIVIIDGAPNLSPIIDSAIQHATHILLIGNPEGQSIKQLSRITQMLQDITNNGERDMTYILNKMFVVLNNAQKPTEYDLGASECSRTIGRPLLREIPNSDIVKKALHSSNKQAIELEPDEPFSIAIKKLANDLVGAYPEGLGKTSKDAVTHKNTKGKESGLFKKIFSKK
ncbi:AAA family ATPase [Wukongibacter baidiensis]